MKPVRFSYHAPESVDEAVRLLDDEVKVLAGGQSLVPAMNFRLARPSALVDINRLTELDRVDVVDGSLVVGALARHRRFESLIEPGPVGRLLTTTARYIGHLPIRVRGTFIGSLAHADPAAEWCTILRVLDGQVIARGPAGRRAIPASGFFKTVFTTDLAGDELIEEVRIPLLSDSYRVGFAEFSRRAGDFALVMAAAVVRLEGGLISEARIAVGGAADVPERAIEAESLLVGAPLTAETIGSAADAASSSLRAFEDIHASVDYRRDLIRAMTRRALAGAE